MIEICFGAKWYCILPWNVIWKESNFFNFLFSGFLVSVQNENLVVQLWFSIFDFKTFLQLWFMEYWTVEKFFCLRLFDTRSIVNVRCMIEKIRALISLCGCNMESADKSFLSILLKRRFVQTQEIGWSNLEWNRPSREMCQEPECERCWKLISLKVCSSTYVELK